MKTKVLLLALVTFFALCGNGFAVDKKQIGAQLQELYGQMAVLESAWMSIVNEGQAVAQEAKKVFAEADRVLKTAQKDNLMCSDALAIVTAGFYEVLLENLALKAKIIEVQMMLVGEEIARLEQQLKALKKGQGV
jgi:hypothetical protein